MKNREERRVWENRGGMIAPNNWCGEVIAPPQQCQFWSIFTASSPARRAHSTQTVQWGPEQNVHRNIYTQLLLSPLFTSYIILKQHVLLNSNTAHAITEKSIPFANDHSRNLAHKEGLTLAA